MPFGIGLGGGREDGALMALKCLFECLNLRKGGRAWRGNLYCTKNSKDREGKKRIPLKIQRSRPKSPQFFVYGGFA